MSSNSLLRTPMYHLGQGRKYVRSELLIGRVYWITVMFLRHTIGSVAAKAVAFFLRECSWLPNL